MKIKEGYLLRNVAGSNIVVPVGGNEVVFDVIITLNDVGGFIWTQLEQEISKEELLTRIVSEYDIDREIASNDMDEYLSLLEREGLIEK